MDLSSKCMIASPPTGETHLIQPAWQNRFTSVAPATPDANKHFPPAVKAGVRSNNPEY